MAGVWTEGDPYDNAKAAESARKRTDALAVGRFWQDRALLLREPFVGGASSVCRVRLRLQLVVRSVPTSAARTNVSTLRVNHPNRKPFNRKLAHTCKRAYTGYPLVVTDPQPTPRSSAPVTTARYYSIGTLYSECFTANECPLSLREAFWSYRCPFKF